MTYTKYSYETNGAYTEVECTVLPGYDNPEHYHTLFAETFTCRSGLLTVTLDGKRLQLKPGEAATVHIGHTHSLANTSDETVDFTCRLEPGYEGFEKAMYIMHGLAQDGATNSDGVPNSPVQLAILAAMMDTWLTGWAFWFAMPLLAIVRRYGKGYGVEAKLVGKYWNSD